MAGNHGKFFWYVNTSETLPTIHKDALYILSRQDHNRGNPPRGLLRGRVKD
jgi:hypothetical protein